MSALNARQYGDIGAELDSGAISKAKEVKFCFVSLRNGQNMSTGIIVAFSAHHENDFHFPVCSVSYLFVVRQEVLCLERREPTSGGGSIYARDISNV